MGQPLTRSPRADRDNYHEQYVVICRDDTIDGQPGAYILATRRVFADLATAEHYASTIATGREPVVVVGRWHQLRFLDRGQTWL